MATLTDELANDIRAIDGDHDLGAAALATALVELGWAKIPIVLGSYREGHSVDVFFPPTGEWMPGHVSSVGPAMVHVDTEKGPVTVMNTARIKRRA